VPRIRRPLLALLALVLALVIGYAIRAARSDGAPARSPTTQTSSHSSRALPTGVGDRA
jgi:hypothetical protein